VTKVSVVIPFYQKTEGILRAAVMSALHQKTDASMQIIVVDDESPISARKELQDLCSRYPDAIVIVEKKNAGVGAARNTGLDHVSPESDYVAFLDSDDVWTDLHIKRALWALDEGYDFYFSDFYQLRQDVTAFSRARRIRLEDHPRIHDGEPIHEYTGSMVDQILSGNILGTSVIVYNFKKFPAVRYPEEFRHAGEDYVFWIRLASASKKIAFSSDAECRYGPGVNIFADSGWGTDKYLSIVYDLMKYRKYLMRNLALTPSQRRALKLALKTDRFNYGKGFLHNLRCNGKITLNVFWKQLILDPQTFLAMALVPGAAIYGKLRRKLLPPKEH
jgi:succinoglycan biosynthesis protein ExoW